MNAPNHERTPPRSELGLLLRTWRGRRGKSQLDLTVDTGISQRHLSFIESGRSRPGRQTLMDIAGALDIPLRERNTLLLAAGYAPLYGEGALDAPEMQSIMKALERMLRQHEPFPALVMDRNWNVLATNAAMPRFVDCFIDRAARRGPRNMLHLIFDPLGLRPFIANWDEAAKALFERIHRESVGRVVDEATRELLAALAAYPDVKAEWKAGPSSPLPMIPLSFAWNGNILRYFSLVTTVGTPQTITAQELRLECLFPADEATESGHVQMLGEGPAFDGRR